MMEQRRQRIPDSRKKARVPLSNLHASEVVRTILAHPHRLDELVNLLGDQERSIRGRAAATLARLSESHPDRLIRMVDRLRDALRDDSAYVRWSLAYALGRIGTSHPDKAGLLIADLGERLDDENRIVRILATRALALIAGRSHDLVREFFSSGNREVPPRVAKILGQSEQNPLRNNSDKASHEKNRSKASLHHNSGSAPFKNKSGKAPLKSGS